MQRRRPSPSGKNSTPYTVQGSIDKLKELFKYVIRSCVCHLVEVFEKQIIFSLKVELFRKVGIVVKVSSGQDDRVELQKQIQVQQAFPTRRPIRICCTSSVLPSSKVNVLPWTSFTWGLDLKFLGMTWPGRGALRQEQTMLVAPNLISMSEMSSADQLPPTTRTRWSEELTNLFDSLYGRYILNQIPLNSPQCFRS